MRLTIILLVGLLVGCELTGTDITSVTIVRKDGQTTTYKGKSCGIETVGSSTSDDKDSVRINCFDGPGNTSPTLVDHKETLDGIESIVLKVGK